jgi:hypothetical protein
MATQENVEAPVPPIEIKPKTKEMEAHLQTGYPMSIEEARRRIKQREADPSSIPYEKYAEAIAMVEAYNAKPKVISKTKGWKRKPINQA